MRLLYVYKAGLTLFFLLLQVTLWSASPQVSVGLDVLFDTPKWHNLLAGKKIGLVTNHTAINKEMRPSVDIFLEKASDFQVVAIFAPEHGLYGAAQAGESVSDEEHHSKIVVYSLHGDTRRPTEKMLRGIDLLIFDIQDIGSRSYTYISTMFYVMEEAAKRGIEMMVLDRPNPINGLVVDGLSVEDRWRTFLGYVRIPYCHGMTVGELAAYFNGEYAIGCKLTVVPMQGWKREMSFVDTGLPWIPTSPRIPDMSTPQYYPMTGMIGHLGLVSIGGGCFPFKVVVAPWIDAELFAKKLNAQKYPGVHFVPFRYTAPLGKFEGKVCQGVLIVVTDPKVYLPVSSQYLILGVLKTLYPEQVRALAKEDKAIKTAFNKANGTEKVYELLENKRYISWDLRKMCQKTKEEFLPIRKKYLNSEYD